MRTKRFFKLFLSIYCTVAVFQPVELTRADVLEFRNFQYTENSFRSTYRRDFPEMSSRDIDTLIREYVSLDGWQARFAPFLVRPPEGYITNHHVAGHLQLPIPRFKPYKDPIKDSQSYLFTPLDPSTGRKADKPVAIPSTLAFVTRELDTHDDVRAIFSNRHEITGATFGSNDYRRQVFSLFDPFGYTELYDGDPVEGAIEGIEEGSLWRFIKKGSRGISSGEQINQGPESVFMSMFSGFNNAAHNDPASDQLWWRHINQPDLSILEPLYAVAKAEKGTGVESGVGELAREGVGMLCAMAHANPAYVDLKHRPMAVRSRWIGLDCYRQLKNILMPYHWASMGNANNPSTAEGLTLKRMVWGVTQDDLASVALDVMLLEPGFLRFVDGNVKLDYGPGTRNNAYGFNLSEISGGDLLEFGRYGRNVFLVNRSVSLHLVEVLMGVAAGSADDSNEIPDVPPPFQPPTFPVFQPGSPPPDPAELMRMMQQNMQQVPATGSPAQESDWGHLTTKARRVLQRLSMGVDAGEHTFNDLSWDRRLFRQAILESAPGRENLVSSLFCQTGWGEPGEFVDYAMNMIDQMQAIISTYIRRPIPSDQIRRIENLMGALVTMQQTAMAGRGNQPLAEAINTRMTKIREWAAKENPESDEISNIRFMRFYAAASPACP